jgi:hypothetical protein
MDNAQPNQQQPTTSRWVMFFKVWVWFFVVSVTIGFVILLFDLWSFSSHNLTFISLTNFGWFHINNPITWSLFCSVIIGIVFGLLYAMNVAFSLFPLESGMPVASLIIRILTIGGIIFANVTAAVFSMNTPSIGNNLLSLMLDITIMICIITIITKILVHRLKK